MDLSNGYESISAEWLARRGNGKTRSHAIGVKEVRRSEEHTSELQSL